VEPASTRALFGQFHIAIRGDLGQLGIRFVGAHLRLTLQQFVVDVRSVQVGEALSLLYA